MDLSLADIAKMVAGRLAGDDRKPILGAAPFGDADETQITFAIEPKLLRQVDTCGAGAVFVPQDFSGSPTPHILVADPKLAFAKVLAHFAPPVHPPWKIDARAVRGDNLISGEQVSIGACAVIGDNVTLGNKVVIYPHVVIGDNAVIGDEVVLHPHVSIGHDCVLGNRVIIQAGTVIGSDGYGFVPDGESWVKMPQTGIVQIDDDVEIGANNTIDRAIFGKTRIRRGVKTDNLVHVAHNVDVGEDSLLIALVGIAGSATIGKHVILAGQSAVADHITVGDNVIAAPKTGIAKSIPAGEVVTGAPAMPHRHWLRVQRIIPLLPELKKRIVALEKKIFAAENK